MIVEPSLTRVAEFIWWYFIVSFQLHDDIGEGDRFSIENEASVLSSYHHVQSSASAIQFKVQWNSYTDLMPERP